MRKSYIIFMLPIIIIVNSSSRLLELLFGLVVQITTAITITCFSLLCTTIILIVLGMQGRLGQFLILTSECRDVQPVGNGLDNVLISLRSKHIDYHISQGKTATVTTFVADNQEMLELGQGTCSTPSFRLSNVIVKTQQSRHQQA